MVVKEGGVRKYRPVLILALVLALSVQILDIQGKLEWLQYKVEDGCYYLSAVVKSRVDRHESPLVVVAITDRELFEDDRFRIPQVLWHHFFSEVIQAVVDGGARGVLLDYLPPQTLFDDMVENYSRVWLKSFFQAKRQGVPVISGVIDIAGRRIRPADRYLQIIGLENIGSYNITPDDDGVVRRQRLYFPTAQDPQFGLPSVSLLLARILKPDLKAPQTRITIDFDPTPIPFPTIDFAEVVRRAADHDRTFLKKNFAGKLVLIGEISSLPRDRYRTPLYHVTLDTNRLTPGVMIMAHVADTLLHERFYAPFDTGFRFLIYVAAALGFSLLTSLCRVRILVISLFLSTALIVVAGVFLYTRYIIAPMAGVLVVEVVGVATAFAYRYGVVDREKRHIRHAFSHYLHPGVVAELIENPAMLTLGGSRRVMTCFFSDLAGFTRLSEKMDPEDLVRLTNRYFTLVTRAIMDHGGTVDKFEGDAVVAFWGAPVFHPDHAVRACLCALQQQVLMSQFAEEAGSRGLPELTARMGVNTGPMVVGNMGSETRFNYTVMGDAVNLASRLEGANKTYGTRIMISEFTYEAVRGRVEVRELDWIRVKGRDKPIRVYELIGPAGRIPDEQPSSERFSSKPWPVIGPVNSTGRSGFFNMPWR